MREGAAHERAPGHRRQWNGGDASRRGDLDVARPAAMRSRSSARSRLSPTTACCSRRCSPARSRSRDIELKPWAWWQRAASRSSTGRRATEIDTHAHASPAEAVPRLAFAKLVLATGSEAVQAAASRRRSLGRPDVSRPRRRGGDPRTLAARRTRRRDRRRAARPRGRLRSQEGRRRRHRRSSHGPADGTPARRPCGRDAERRT